MKSLMRCLFCGLLQDEPLGVKTCQRCGGELAFEEPSAQDKQVSYLSAQMELDQINAPAGQTVDRHLLISIRTPKKVPEEHLAKTESGRPPLSFNVILDVSGSMHGGKIENTKKALRMAAHLLREGDRIAMTVFSGNAKTIMKPTPFNEKSRKIFESVVNELRPGGGTALFSGLDLGLQQAKQMQSENNLTLLLSDGQANIGETDLEMIGFLAKKGAENNMIVSTLGVGMDYNEALMTEIATQGKGRFYHVQSPDEIASFITGELGEAADLAARDVKIHIQLPKGAALIPLSAAYHCEIKNDEAIISVGDISVDLEVEIPLRLTLFPGKENDRLAFEGKISHLTPSDSKLTKVLNRVTVRFIKQKEFKVETGVVKPVAERIAKQMHAKQVLNFSRAFSRKDQEEIQNVEAERTRFREYIELLDEDFQEKYSQELDEDLSSLQNASPNAKDAVYRAYQTQRSMRDPKNKK
jgi:Ca-activated chloride channel homolog